MRNIDQVLFKQTIGKCAAVVAFLMALLVPAAAQDYTGIYYIASGGKSQANGNSYTYNPSTPSNNFYLCPTEGWCFYKATNDFTGTDNGQPFFTTYKCRTNDYHSGNSSDAIWTIEKAPAPNSNYYYIRQTSTGKYMLSNGQIRTSTNADRIRVHLEAVTGDLDDKALFALEPVSGQSYVVIRIVSPDGINGVDHQWLSVCYGNYNNLIGNSGKNGGPTGYVNVAGTVCIYTQDDANAPFYLEPATVDPPTITNNYDGTITITSETGATIYYTVGDGSQADPTTSTPTTGTTSVTITLESNETNIKAIAKGSEDYFPSLMSEYSLPQYDAPTISFNNTTLLVSIDPGTGGIAYYTTDGSTPTTSSTAYSAPFTVAAATTVKAIATHAGYLASTVAELAITQVATPTIQDNGSNAVSITCATTGATIYYTTDGSTPTTSSTEYTGPLTEGVSGVTIKAIAVKANMINSEVGSGSVTLQCAAPVITRNGNSGFIATCAFPATGVTIYYTTDGSTTPTTSTPTHINSGESVAIALPVTVKAIAVATNYNNSAVTTTIVSQGMGGSGTALDPYTIEYQSDVPDFITKANDPALADKYYKVISTEPLDFSGVAAITQPFSGNFDGNLQTLTGLGHALFNTVNGGTVKNVILDNVGIGSGTNVGAICNEAMGDSRIYNCGVLGGTLTGSGKVGGIVGLLDGTSHVVNCYSYATITSGSDVGGIVGYNNGNTYWTTSALHVETMVMNCMFYGDITGGTNVSPVYGGNNINNVYVNDESNIGLNTFNYYAYDELHTASITAGKYNCALAVEGRYLRRFEFYRLLLNSNKKLAAIYASTTSTTVQPEEMAKWVLETADRTIATPKPFPILKEPGRYYPSVINMDAAHADQITFDENGQIPEADRNKGGKLGTLAVTISESNTTSGGQTKPVGATVETTSLTLVRTDKDYDRYNYNYDKVQLPYYNEVGTNNYTGNRVVTGWKITNITPVTNDPYTSSNYPSSGIRDYPDHNYADRKSSKKDLYSVSGRVFSQGAYFDVPYGVTSITIEPYWAKAAYVADENYDVVYNADYSTKKNVTQIGTQVGSGATFNNDANQLIKTSVSDALSAISSPGSTVYDNAVVLVGNLHLNNVPSQGTTPFTMMSVDMDNDHEPDYSLIYHHKGRTAIAPIRYDFLAIPGTAQAQKPNGADLICNFTIFKTKGWFEATNTSLFYTSQVEYENLKEVTKTDAPLILQGGVIEQFVSTQQDTVKGNTIYIHLGGNVWIHEFGMGTHSDGSYSTPHVPVSVTGGDYDGFYLTGTYNSNARIRDDNAECYISSGRFGEVAGAAQEQIGNNTTNNGNVRWQIYNADIDNFFGGGVNDAKPVKGNITTEIYNSHVNLFCGGPKFGNMATSKTVTTTAEGCVFDKYFGAGYGGNSYSRKKYYDKSGTPKWSTLEGYYTGDKGKYYDGATTGSSQNGGSTNYGYKGPGVATDFDYEFFVWSSGTVGVRFFVKFASFSLAQCNNVNSTLKGCTINENFYGAGSLGKVTGTVTSELEGCTVKGNVFGAGYSATLPEIPVRSAGFVSGHTPNFNSSSGMFEQGTFSDTTHYTWKHVDSYPADASAGFDGTQVITTVNLSKTNLGSVSGAVTLTLKGNTKVGTFDGSGNLLSGGNVYGGGDESVVSKNESDQEGNTTVKLQGNTHVGGNVYGGGNNGSVGGNSEVIIQDD